MSGPCFRSMAMFHIVGYVSVSRPCFNIHVFVSSVYFCIKSIFQVKGMFNCSFLVYIKVYSLLLGLYVSLFLCFMNSIHSKDIHLKIKSYFCKFLCFMSYTFIIYHIFTNFTSSMFYVLGLFLQLFRFSFLQINWEAFQVKHLQVKVLKMLQQELIRPSLGCMPPYCLGQKFDFDDNTVIVSKTLLRKINFVLQDMGRVTLV